MKKIFGFLICMLLCLCLLSCIEEEQPLETPYEGEKKIVFWHTMGDRLQIVLQQAINDFQENNTDWDIEAVQFGGTEDIVQEVLKGSIKPYLVYSYPEDIIKYKNKNLIVDLNTFINDKEIGLSQQKINDFVPAFYEEGKAYGDNAMYSLPFSKVSEVLYYDKVDEKICPKTWEELAQIKDSSHPTLYVNGESYIFTTMAAQKSAAYTTLGNNPYVFNNEENKETVRMLKSWFDEDKLVTSRVGSKSSKFELASSGAMARYLSRYQNLRFAPIPTFSGKASKYPFQGPSLCMLKQHKEKMLKTWDFIINYLLEPGFQAKFSKESLFNPVVQSAYEDEDFKTWLATDDPAAQVLSLCKSYVNSYYYNVPFAGSEKAFSEVGQIIIDVLNNTKTIDKAFEDAIKNCKA